MEKKRIKEWMKRHTAAALVLALILTGAGLFCISWLGCGTEKLQEGIAGEIIRFHVLGNSDSQEDQQLKLRVKDGLVEYLKPMLSGAKNVDETREILQEHTVDIQQKARELIAQEGYPYGATAELTTCYFPIKTYGDCTFPAGNYEALRVEIGAADGKNWWCVLYPNLCFIDALHGIVPEEQKQELQHVLTEEEYDSLFQEQKIKFKFWIWDRDF